MDWYSFKIEYVNMTSIFSYTNITWIPTFPISYFYFDSHNIYSHKKMPKNCITKFWGIGMTIDSMQPKPPFSLTPSSISCTRIYCTNSHLISKIKYPTKKQVFWWKISTIFFNHISELSYHISEVTVPSYRQRKIVQ